MPEHSAEIDLGIKQILPLVGVIAALVMWRLNATHELVDQMVLLHRYRRSGFATKWVRVAWRVRTWEASVLVLAVLACGLVFFEAYHYMRLTDNMIGRSAWVDIGVLDSFGAHAVEAKRDAVKLAFVGMLLAIVDWLIPLVFRPGHVRLEDIPSVSHAFVIPSEWAVAPATMWEDRIQVAAGALKGYSDLHDELENAWSSGSWRSDWPTWAKCVIGYQVVAAGQPAGNTESVRG